ncbi:CHRD domain-containing protein [Rubrivirga sp. IMCC45206]|uniref:CHRD domain-containing protein n=1 Tax=Rubrivirga sp. IMCC45206 TaxID=3391614 RepID=UPI00398FEFF3
MRHRCSLGLLALVLSFAPSALAQTYVATLAGANEVPPVTTGASGTVFAAVDGFDVTISGSFSGLESAYAASHIHTGEAGTNGGVLFPLSPTVDADERGGTFDETLTFSQAQLDALAAGGLYINVHSADNGGGEIRGQLGGPVTAFVNELHYDNVGSDEGEFVEVAVPTGTDVDDLVLTLYNGNGGTSYGTFTGDTFTAGATTNGFTLYTVDTPGLQNGASSSSDLGDGLALSTADGTVLQFLSYENTFTATDGPASGLTSTDIGVSEDPAPDAGQSLQLTGAGTVADDFAWTGPVAQTRGAANAGQTFGGGTGGGGDPVTIGEARAAGVGATVTVEGTVTRAMGDFLYIQDETAGLAIRQVEGDLFEAVADGSVGPGTVLRVSGTLSAFRQSLQINEDDLAGFEALGTEAIPAAQTVTLAELAANGEAYEDELVRIEDVTIQGSGAFEPATTYGASDGSGANGVVTVRVPNAGDSTVDGTDVPAGPVALVGIVGQFSPDEVPDIGYQLLLISADDVNPEGVASEGGPDGALTLALANPIRGAALVTFGAERAGPVRLAVFDALGREVAVLASGDAPAGPRTATLDAATLAPGVYLVRLTTDAGSVTRTVTVVR